MNEHMTREDALAAGYTIDDHCYPPVAYKGSRFNPTRWRNVLTPLEEELLAACEEFVRKVDAGEARSTRSYAQMKAAIASAKGEAR